MALKNRKRMSSRLFGKFSLKTKVIIFCVLCIFSIALIGKDIYMNKKNENVIQKSKNITENSVIKPADGKKDEEKKYDEAQKFFSNKKYSDAIAKADEIINEDKEFYKA